MRVVVEIPPDLVDEIRSAVRSGNYESPDEFLEQALRTQLELESGQQETLQTFNDAIAVGDDSDDDQETVQERSNSPPLQSNETGANLEDLSLRDFDVSTVPPPSPDRIDTGPLWGQYNRIFPMKLVVRRLAIVLDETGEARAPYEEFREKTATVARAYGFRLQEADEKLGRGRGEKFSAAFPTGDKVDRSLDRFETHFVGQFDQSGNLTGALPNLQFVDIDVESETFGLTSAGLTFAQIENPLLDEDIESEMSLSDSERRFYLDHVASEHEAEAEAMEVVAKAIANGIDRPDPLSERVSEFSDDWSAAQASTVRSGLVGRMHELGLVTRKRVGSRGIGYELTDLGDSQLL